MQALGNYKGLVETRDHSTGPERWFQNSWAQCTQALYIFCIVSLLLVAKDGCETSNRAVQSHTWANSSVIFLNSAEV